MAEWLARIPAPILLATYAQHTAKRLDIGEDVLRKEVAKLTGNRRDRRNASEGDAEGDETADIGEGRPRGLPAEEMLLRAMLPDERVIELAAGTLDLAWLSDSVAGQTIQEVLRLQNGPLGRPELPAPRGRTRRVRRLVSELLLNRQTIKIQSGKCRIVLRCCNDAGWRSRSTTIGGCNSQRGLPPDEMATLLQQLLDLDSKLRHIATLLRGEQ